MEKLFLDVFSGADFDRELSSWLDEVRVRRISLSKNRDNLRIYICSEHIVPKRFIHAAEDCILKKYFKSGDVRVKIYEQYHLSGLYDLGSLMENYYDSILLDCRRESNTVYSILKHGRYEVTDRDTVCLILNDGYYERQTEPMISHALDRMINERFSMSVNFIFRYEKLKNDKKQEYVYSDHGVTESEGNPSADMTQTPDKRPAAHGDEGSDLERNKSVPTAVKAAPSGKINTKKAPYRNIRKVSNPDVIYGRDFDDNPVSMEDILGEIGEITVRGMISEIEARPLARIEKTLVSVTLTDFTDSIKVKLFIPNEQAEEFESALKAAKFIRVKGVPSVDKFDHELTISSVAGIMKTSDFRIKREDLAPEKRVELHCHTKMSDMDGVSDVKDILKAARGFGHRALAITDHGVVQAFPDAFHLWCDWWKSEKKRQQEAGAEKPSKDGFFKVIYGVEGYLVDDLNRIVSGEADCSLDDSFVVFDIETTGLSADRDRIIEIGAVLVSNGSIIKTFSEFVNPGRPIPYDIEKLTGITDDMVSEADSIDKVLPRFLEFCKGSILVAHNAAFDTGFIRANAVRLGLEYDFTHLDTLAVSRVFFPSQHNHRLDMLAKTLGVSLDNHHRAVDDAGCTAEIFVKLIPMFRQKGKERLRELNDLSVMSPEAIKRLRPYHVIILAKNDIGRINMYKLISASHLDYFAKCPRIPKSLLEKHREGIIVGSACEAGELCAAIIDERSEEDITRIASFYDYLEIQPVGNNSFMIEKEKIRSVNSIEDIRNINSRIVRLGERLGKPVVATGDVHFLNPEDEVYRRIIMAGKGFDDADDQAPLYLHTTDEMLEEFSYLGAEKAMEVVVTNTNLIADSIDYVEPVRPDKCPPVIENSDGILRDICERRAAELYGSPLPQIVRERLDRELNSIISNGFAVMYIIAQKLVWKSVEDGYLVGSRGSVGSSFVATMAGITEVNPLSPHYYCTKCHFTDFDSEEVRTYISEGRAGCDMPDRICPNCGSRLSKDGFDIPFETFLGFNGDKEPDIDLNFSGEYQSKAHKYTEVIFGAGQTFRAGTIGTLADKTAYGFVKHYYEEHGQSKRECEINRIVEGCTGVRRSTGQHPGGIIVLPMGEEINSFTPIQHPANDTATDIVTTHFDYHSIDHNLLKLDILGHDDPTMIRMLQDLTGEDPVLFPLDDKKVMSIFHSTEALGITPDNIGGCQLGCLGIPEFGTGFTIQMLIDTKPSGFSDLVRIAGLSHGTDVWLGNAQTLIQEGLATISTAICTRDDIMVYLIQKGVEPGRAFKIMENVRKGNVAKHKCADWDAWKEDMKAHDVPDWYIGSCEKIMYMFPKAHAAAYVMMAWRIAYCKVYFPLAYYTAFFSIRAKAFSYEIMCRGPEYLQNSITEYENKEKPTAKEENLIKDMYIVREMYARGFEFMPIDLFRAHSRNFQIIDGKIMPSFTSIDGMGETAADSLMEAAKDGPFLSKEDLRERSKISKTTVELMDSLGLLEGLPESNQLSLFDFM